jgi:hypothetical protein
LAVMIIRILPAILNFFLLKIVTVRITTAVFQKLVDKFFSLLIRHSRLRNEPRPSELVGCLYNLIIQLAKADHQTGRDLTLHIIGSKEGCGAKRKPRRFLISECM